MSKTKHIIKAPKPTLRRAASRFRLNKNRDDHNPGFDSVRVFCPSPLAGGSHVGVFGAPVVVLNGYRLEPVNDLNSVVADPNAYIVGRMVDFHPDELARLDQVAEAAPHLMHRFLAEVHGPQTGAVFSAWVYQADCHAGEIERKTSATALTETSTKALK